MRRAIRCWDKYDCRQPNVASRWQTHGSCLPIARRICKRAGCPMDCSREATDSIDDIFTVMNIFYPVTVAP